MQTLVLARKMCGLKSHPSLLRSGHYGVVRIGTDKASGVTVAIKTVPKRRAVYVDMLKLEVEILRVR